MPMQLFYSQTRRATEHIHHIASNRLVEKKHTYLLTFENQLTTFIHFYSRLFLSSKVAV